MHVQEQRTGKLRKKAPNSSSSTAHAHAHLSQSTSPPGHFDANIADNSKHHQKHLHPHLRRSESESGRHQPRRGNSTSSPQRLNTHKRSPTLQLHTTTTTTDAAAPHSLDHPNRAPSPQAATPAPRLAGQLLLDTQYPRLSVTRKSSSDLLGQRFDSADVLNNLNAVSYNADYDDTYHNSTAAYRQHAAVPQTQPTPPTISQHQDPLPDPASVQPSPSHSGHQSPAIANPNVRLSTSLAATGRRMEDITNANGTRSPRQRYSDEGKEAKSTKKKSGFSGILSSLVGTPRKPTISAPENPVHVTHVGYDADTGEFTVSTPDSDTRAVR